jgi:predicted AAA+ superfamily ATPase
MIKERNLLSKVVNHLLKKEYTIIIGARQTGKTTLLKQLFQICKNNGDSCYFLSFEDFTILNSVNQHPENIFKFVEKTFDNQFTKRLFLFIDEIQYASNPTNFLKYLYDIYEEKIKIVATGSSAFYIDKRFTDSLAGRKRIFHLKQLNFSEYLHFRNADELQNELKLLRNNEDYISIKRNDISYFFEEYLCFGSYPAVVLENDREEKIEILKELKNSFLKKDISEAGVLYEHKFLQLMVLLAEQIGNLVNKNELANTLGIDNKTI